MCPDYLNTGGDKPLPYEEQNGVGVGINPSPTKKSVREGMNLSLFKEKNPPFNE